MEKKKTKKILTFEDYLRQIADESQPLSVAVLYQLSGMDEDNLALFELAWSSISTRRRREIVRHLADIAETNFEVDCDPVFAIGLSDSDPEVRIAAIDGLWVSEGIAQIVPLSRMLAQDPVADVRAAAASALARFVLLGELDELPRAYQGVLQDTRQILRAVIASPAEDLKVRRRAVEAIAYSGDQDIPAIIKAAYQSPEAKMRVSALCGMGRSADNQWKDIVVKELESASPEMRFESARAAGELELRKAVPKLAALLDDPDREVQDMAIWALGQIGGEKAFKLLTQCYEEGDEAIKAAVGDALEEMSMMRGEDMPLFAFDPDEEDQEDPEDWMF